ncbi:hypothetical protein RND71_043414 [Anisodus tanguticus]|uniref:Ubiquitin carboxyl-terminal hydrolase n=1 Tax=Anisodus tanguticus TaxID=243964 RepID=A0AAE1QPM0_9SOLA|nr:hypothetical protein RND71_043414 [Anisodus tanguticus]
MNFKPLESNPEVINQFLACLGLEPSVNVSDIFGFTAEHLNFVTQPVLAVIFLYPCKNDINEDFTLLNETEEETELKDKETIEGLYFIKQTIKNACGAIALIHSVANNFNNINFSPDSIAKKFVELTRNLSPSEKAKFLESDESIKNINENCAAIGTTPIPDIVDIHFVSFVEHNGYLWKLDGRKDRPQRVNIATKETVLESSAKYCEKFCEKNPNILSFAALSFSKN